MDAEALLRPVIEGQGFELYDVIRRRERDRTVLEVVVDGPEGVDVDALAALSGRVTQELDARDPRAGTYDLRVSSPGLERLLRRPEHFRRAVGKRVKVRTTSQIEGSRSHTGTLVSADDEGCTLEVGGTGLYLPYAGIGSARTVVDWGAELKGSNA